MPRPRSEKARQAVLHAARALLERDGYDAITMEGIAAEAEVSKQTIYRWWPSKAHVLGEALLEGELPGMPNNLPSTGDLAADLRTWISLSGAHLAQSSNGELARALIAVTATDAALGEALNERFAGPIERIVRTRIEQAVVDGQARADVDPQAIADLFVAATSYAALIGKPLSPARLDAIAKVLVDGML